MSAFMNRTSGARSLRCPTRSCGNTSGMTLLEVLLATSLLALLVSALVPVLSTSRLDPRPHDARERLHFAIRSWADLELRRSAKEAEADPGQASSPTKDSLRSEIPGVGEVRIQVERPEGLREAFELVVLEREGVHALVVRRRPPPPRWELPGPTEEGAR